MAGKQLSASEGIDRKALYPLSDAIGMIKERASAKFDESIVVAMNLGVDPRHADQMVWCICPTELVKLFACVFAKDAKAEEAKAAGADVVGADDLMRQCRAEQLILIVVLQHLI